MTDTYTFQDQVNAIILLRKMYKNSRVGKTIPECVEIWNEILQECERRKINTDIIQIEEETFRLMLENEQVIVDYLKK